MMVWRVRCHSDGDDGAARRRLESIPGRELSSRSGTTTCELAGSARLRKRDWTGAGGKENASPRRVNIASLMPPVPDRSDMLRIVEVSPGQPGPGDARQDDRAARSCAAPSRSPRAASSSQSPSRSLSFGEPTGTTTRRTNRGGRGACVVRVESRRDERGTKQRVDRRSRRGARAGLPARLAMRWDTAKRWDGWRAATQLATTFLTTVPNGPRPSSSPAPLLGKMHAWRFRASDSVH